MNKKPQARFATEAKFTYDKWGIMCCECPKCEGFIPNVQVGSIMKCPNCQYEFKVIE